MIVAQTKTNTLIIIIFSILFLSFTHIRPIPSLPENFNVYSTNDLFSMDVISKVHTTLFKLVDYTPMPELIEDFNVSEDQKIYTFILKNKKFHNGKLLNFGDVKYSLEQAIKNKVLGYKKLSLIKGFSDFENGKNKDLVGLTEGKSNNIFQIQLIEKSSSLIKTLTEFRFSIIPSDGDHKNGLGPYYIDRDTENEIVLKLNKDFNSNLPDQVIYKKATKENAINGFLKNEFHDLLAYPITYNDTKKIKNAHIQLTHIPRVYLLAINPFSYPDKSERSFILNQINKTLLIEKCYPQNDMAFSVIPPGFPGFIPNQTPSENNVNFLKFSKNELRIQIAKGVGNEECVFNFLNETFSHHYKVKLEIVDTDVMNKNWINNKIDAFFAYIEAGSTFDFFQCFNPNSVITLGNFNDKKIGGMISTYEMTYDLEKKYKIAQEISIHILNQKTVLPIFFPKQYLVYHRKYRKINVGISLLTFLDFNVFKLE